MAPKKKKPKTKNPGGVLGELNLFGDGALDRARHLAEKLEVDLTDVRNEAGAMLSALRKATSDEAVRQAHAEAVRDSTYPAVKPKKKMEYPLHPLLLVRRAAQINFDVTPSP